MSQRGEIHIDHRQLTAYTARLTKIAVLELVKKKEPEDSHSQLRGETRKTMPPAHVFEAEAGAAETFLLGQKS